MKVLEKILQRYLGPALLAILSIWHALWAFDSGRSVAGLLAAMVSAGLFGLCLLRLPPVLHEWLVAEDVPLLSPGVRAARRDRRHPWGAIVVRVLLLHLLLYAAAYCFDLAKNGYSGGILDTLPRLWNRTDAPHYQGIAQNWYVTEGDARLHIVFFPLYPLLTRLFSIGGNYFSGAMLLTALCAAGSAILAYELAALDMERKDALFTATLLSVFPGSIFLAAPMTESLFLLLCLGCMLAVRKKRYPVAGLLGGLAAFTRSVGVLLVLPVFIEVSKDWLRSRPSTPGDIAKRICSVCIIPLGTAGYLLINYLVTGSAFTFLTYQSQHWSQQLGPFFSTAAYQTDLFITNISSGKLQLAYGLFLPNLICAFGFLGLLLPSMNKLRPSYSGYALLYFAVSIGCTWLLSGPRYLAVCFPIAFAIARLTEKRKLIRLAAGILLLISMLVYLYMFVTGYPVY